MSRFKIVALDVWKKQMKSASFWFMVAMPFIMILVGGIIGYFSSNIGSADRVAFLADESLRPYIEENRDLIGDYEYAHSEEEARNMLDEDEISYYTVVENQDGVLHFNSYGSGIMGSDSMMLTAVTQNMQNQVNEDRAELSSEQEGILQTKPVLEKHEVKTNYANPVTTAAFFGTTLILYMMLITYSNIMVVDIATEKGTKMIEFIFSSVTAGTYFAGKIAGNFLVILTHLLIYLFGAVIAFAIFQSINIQLPLDLPPIDAGVLQSILLIMLFGLFGLFIYMIVAGMLGSLATKQEDAGKMATPIIMICILSYFIAITFMGKEVNGFIIALSYIPFFSTFFMPMRLIYDNTLLIEPLISLAVLIASTGLVYLFAAKVYKKNILNYSSDKLFGRGKK